MEDAGRERRFNRRLFPHECENFIEHARWLHGFEQRNIKCLEDKYHVDLVRKDAEINAIKNEAA
jgi:hypothetical protein